MFHHPSTSVEVTPAVPFDRHCIFIQRREQLFEGSSLSSLDFPARLSKPEFAQQANYFGSFHAEVAQKLKSTKGAGGLDDRMSSLDVGMLLRKQYPGSRGRYRKSML
jgi:hypothetical protein